MTSYILKFTNRDGAIFYLQSISEPCWSRKPDGPRLSLISKTTPDQEGARKFPTLASAMDAHASCGDPDGWEVITHESP